MYFSLFLFHRLFPLEYVFSYNISLMQQGKYSFNGCSEKSNLKYLLELFKRRSKVHQKNNVWNVLEILTNGKHFPKVISQ